MDGPIPGLTPPLAEYYRALVTGHLPTLLWYWSGRDPKLSHAMDLEFPAPPGRAAHTSTILAAHGHLAARRRARALGCEWGAGTCEYAARAGHLVLIQWALENGCPWTPEAINAAETEGHTEVTAWLRDHRP